MKWPDMRSNWWFWARGIWIRARGIWVRTRHACVRACGTWFIRFELVGLGAELELVGSKFRIWTRARGSWTQARGTMIWAYGTWIHSFRARGIESWIWARGIWIRTGGIRRNVNLFSEAHGLQLSSAPAQSLQRLPAKLLAFAPLLIIKWARLRGLTP